jgi:mannose-6-phosphate isomerase-like protein (cupin superfamily)
VRVSEGNEIQSGDGYAAAPDLGALGEGYGFRKVRKDLGVNAFGANVITIPPGYVTGAHFHDEQEEVYFVHRGAIEMIFGEAQDQKVELREGGVARVDASTHRSVRNLSDTEDAVYLCVGGKDGYVGRDGRLPEGEDRAPGPHGDVSS